MAKQKGIIKLVGSLGDITFYLQKGKGLAKTKGGGFTTKSNKFGKNMKLARKNSSEFGSCSTFNKEFRISLRAFHRGYFMVPLHSRLMKIFKKIKDLDRTSKHGERDPAIGILTETGRQLLVGYPYTPKQRVQNSYPFTITPETGAHTYALHTAGIPDFPKSATHAELVTGILHFNPETQAFKPFLYEPVTLQPDDWPETITLSPSFTLPEGGVHWLVIALQFYQDVAGTRYNLRGAKGLGLGVVATGQ